MAEVKYEINITVDNKANTATIEKITKGGVNVEGITPLIISGSGVNDVKLKNANAKLLETPAASTEELSVVEPVESAEAATKLEEEAIDTIAGSGPSPLSPLPLSSMGGSSKNRTQKRRRNQRQRKGGKSRRNVHKK